MPGVRLGVAGVEKSSRKSVNKALEEDPFLLSDPFSTVGSGSDDSMAWSSDKPTLQGSSSDDDPHLGQVTPHHLISPTLRRTYCDPPSDDSIPSSPSRHLAARRKARMSV